MQTQARGFRHSADFRQPFGQEPWTLAFQAASVLSPSADECLERLAVLIACHVPFPAESDDLRHYSGHCLWRMQPNAPIWAQSPEGIAQFEVQALALAECWEIQTALPQSAPALRTASRGRRL